MGEAQITASHLEPYNKGRRRCVMDRDSQERFLALLKKTAADIIADWKWPAWRRDDEEPPQRGDTPGSK